MTVIPDLAIVCVQSFESQCRFCRPRRRLEIFALSSVYIGGDQAAEEGQVRKIKHRFSEPWEDSDVILVVEDEKFHVHRLILSMNSPVFKAMFKSQSKEATANEIPLPGKKANGVLDFLKIIYGFRYVKEHVEITSKYF